MNASTSAEMWLKPKSGSILIKPLAFPASIARALIGARGLLWNLLGSVANDVRHRTNIPVLMVRVPSS